MANATPSPDDVRREVEAWLDESWDPELTVAQWWGHLADAGYTSPTLPLGFGGRGWGRDLALVASQAMGSRGVVGPPMGLGLMLAAPTIVAHASRELQDRFVPRIVRGEDAWCQLFSEPGAGSDLAGLQTKAVRDGDEWVITGQKVWTSGAQLARWGMLLARTDPDAPKHKGISYFAFDMDQPGVEVRPLREMTGRAMFNEVFIDEARVPHANLIGDLNQGWTVANTTLMVERQSIGSGGGAGLGVAHPGPRAAHLGRRVGDFVGARTATAAAQVGPATVPRFADLARSLGRGDDAVVRQGLAQLHILTELNRLNTMRARSGQGRTGGEGNLAKLLLTHTLRHARDVANWIVGAHGTLWGHDALTGGLVQEMTVFSPGPAIYGGTDQVQRNIVGERVLGLPKEPGHERDVPFRDLLANPATRR